MWWQRGIAQMHSGFLLKAATTRRNTNYYVSINGNQGSYRVERETARWADGWPILFYWRRYVQTAGMLRTEFPSGATEIYFFMPMWFEKLPLLHRREQKTRRVAQRRSVSLAMRLVNSATSSASPLISCAVASATDATR